MSPLASAECNNPLNAKQITPFREIAVFSGGRLAGEFDGVSLGPPFQFDWCGGSRRLRTSSHAGGSRNPMQPGGRAEARIVEIPQLENNKRREDGRYGRHLDRAAADADPISRRLRRRLFPRRKRKDGTSGAEVVIAGRRCPVAGRVWDLTAVRRYDREKNAVRRVTCGPLCSAEGITVTNSPINSVPQVYEV